MTLPSDSFFSTGRTLTLVKSPAASSSLLTPASSDITSLRQAGSQHDLKRKLYRYTGNTEGASQCKPIYACSMWDTLDDSLCSLGPDTLGISAVVSGTDSVRAGPQLTAGYTINTYSKPPLYYTLGAVAPLLPCLRTAHTHSDLAALCRTRTDRQTRLTNQPTGQQPFCQYPAVSWELAIGLYRR